MTHGRVVYVGNSVFIALGDGRICWLLERDFIHPLHVGQQVRVKLMKQYRRCELFAKSVTPL